MARDYYDILGVSKDASDDEIKKAYRALAAKYHPDVSSDPNATEKMAKINEAYDTLKDPAKKANYDQYGFYGSDDNYRTDYGSEYEKRSNYNPNHTSYEYHSGYIYPRSGFSLGRFLVGLIFIGLILETVVRLVISGASLINNINNKNSAGSSNYFSYEYYDDGSSIIVSSYDGDNSNVIVPETYNGHKIIGIGEEAFKNNTFVQEIRINSNIIHIEKNAFKGCINLKKVVFLGDETAFNTWKSIRSIASGNDYFTKAKFSYSVNSL